MNLDAPRWSVAVAIVGLLVAVAGQTMAWRLDMKERVVRLEAQTQLLIRSFEMVEDDEP